MKPVATRIMMIPLETRKRITPTTLMGEAKCTRRPLPKACRYNLNHFKSSSCLWLSWKISSSRWYWSHMMELETLRSMWPCLNPWCWWMEQVIFSSAKHSPLSRKRQPFYGSHHYLQDRSMTLSSFHKYLSIISPRSYHGITLHQERVVS